MRAIGGLENGKEDDDDHYEGQGTFADHSQHSSQEGTESHPGGPPEIPIAQEFADKGSQKGADKGSQNRSDPQR